MSLEALLVTVFFLLPGYAGLQLFDWLVADSDLNVWETTTWSLGISVVSAAPLLAFDTTRFLLEHLLHPSRLSADALLGVTIHMLMSLLVAAVAAWLVTSVLGGRFRKSIFQSGWDWLWYQFGQDDRYLLVRSTEGIFYGTLAFADNRRDGQGLVLRDPAKWDEDEGSFVRSGMKYLILDGDKISSIEMSVANPPAESDQPVPTAGPISQESHDDGQTEDPAPPGKTD